MKKPFAISIAILMTIAIFVGCASDNDNGDGLNGTITLNGSTSVDRVIRMLGEAFEEMHNGNVTVNWNPTGSGGGIEAATNGTVHIGLSSRNLRDTETGVSSMQFAIDGLAVIVHPSNPVTNLTIEQIAAIYTGEVTNWNQVGGNNAPIAVIGRDAASGSRDAFDSIIGIVDNTAHDEEHASGGSVITSVAGNPNAIGYTSLSGVNATVSAISVNGVAITYETLHNGTYPVARPFIFVLNNDVTLPAHAQAFLDFVMSPAATEIIARAGVLQVELD